MLYSMTGYGQGVVSSDDVVVFAEAKSVNSRFFEASLKLPTILSGTDAQFLKIIKNYVSRGKVYLSVHLVKYSGSSLWNISVDEQMLDAYASLLEQIDSRLVPEHTCVSLDRFLTMSDLIVKVPEEEAQKRVFRVALSAADEAMKVLRKSRRDEGKLLQRDIQKRLLDAKLLVRKIKKLHDSYSPSRFKKLREAIETMADDIEIDQIRLAQEIAYIATKSDCTEEIIRLETHFARMDKAIKSRKPVGSMLNFTLQECHRETNTIASKTDIPEVSSLVIDLKEQLERIKEQVQNIE
ncbi:YicC family protein [bacterium]|nr:YicC family protein [bacterium]